MVCTFTAHGVLSPEPCLAGSQELYAVCLKGEGPLTLGSQTVLEPLGNSLTGLAPKRGELVLLGLSP